MAGSPTIRSLAEARGRGWLCSVTEHWHYYAKQRRDLHGFCDIHAMDVEAQRFVAIQACIVGDMSHRLHKIREERAAEASAWLACGGRILIWGWGRYKLKRGGKAVRWRLREREVLMEDFFNHEGGNEDEQTNEHDDVAAG